MQLVGWECVQQPTRHYVQPPDLCVSMVLSPRLDVDVCQDGPRPMDSRGYQYRGTFYFASMSNGLHTITQNPQASAYLQSSLCELTLMPAKTNYAPRIPEGINTV